MNSFEILFNSSKAIGALQQAIFAHFKSWTGSGLPFEPLEPTVETHDAKIEIHNLGLLRFNTLKGMATYGIGFRSPEQKATWESFRTTPKAPPADGSTPPPPSGKTPEFEFMKMYYMAIEQIMKDNGSPIDQKTAILQEGPSLGAWKSVFVEKAVGLKFKGVKHELEFVIPILSLEEARSRTMEMYGFKESARILVVDDALTSRKQSRNCLAMAGYFNVDECADGKAALAKVKGGSPPVELVVADWHMPVMSGFEMLKEIRALPQFKKLPVILVTGEKNKDEVVSALKEGVSGYLVKPMTPEGFYKALQKAGGRG